VGVDLRAAPVPDETTICRFRHLLERHDLCGLMLDAVNRHLEVKRIKIATGTIVDGELAGFIWAIGQEIRITMAAG
jgi:IS5 family transposase